jgi:hypothetical protein
MASVTLTESAKLAQDDLVAGVIETVVTVNPMFDVLPFDGVEGNALAFNRENAIGGVISATVGTNLATASGGAAKAAATFTQVTATLKKIIGDAEVDNLIQATRSGDGNDQEAVQIASKAKAVGREYQRQLILGNSSVVAEEFDGLDRLTSAGQTITPASGTQAFSFALLDQLIEKVIDKDGVVDYFAANNREIRSFYSLLRKQGGATIGDTVELPSGASVPAYRGTPLFRNDYIPITQDVSTQGDNDESIVFAGTLDDGSRMHGIAGLTAANAAGIRVVPVGQKEDADETLTRIVWYCSLANFSQLGLAKANAVVGLATD